MLVKLVFDVGQRELGSPDGDLQFRKKPGERTDVVLVPVGEDDGANALPVFGEIRDVRDNDIHAEEFGLREHQSGVDYDYVVAPAHGHAIHAELAEATQRDYLEFSGWH
jgi:hypothetical protein